MRTIFVALCLVTACDRAPEPGPLTLRVTAYNVMCSFCGDGHFDAYDYDDWPTRLPHLQQQLAAHDADLIGLQELLYTYENPATNVRDEVADLGGRGEVYGSIYYERDMDDPHSSMDYPDATILYRKSMFEPVRSGHFWLSPEPDEPFSTGFDPAGQLPRIVVWAELKLLDRERSVIFATTHVDNNSPSQELSAPLIRERMKAIAAGLPVIIVGDFNAGMEHPAYEDLVGDADWPLADTYSLTEAPRGDGPESWVNDYPWVERIDHIFVRPAEAFEVSDWWIDLAPYNEEGPKFASDHRPVHAEFTIKED